MKRTLLPRAAGRKWGALTGTVSLTLEDNTPAHPTTVSVAPLPTGEVLVTTGGDTLGVVGSWALR